MKVLLMVVQDVLHQCSTSKVELMPSKSVHAENRIMQVLDSSACSYGAQGVVCLLPVVLSAGSCQHSARWPIAHLFTRNTQPPQMRRLLFTVTLHRLLCLRLRLLLQQQVQVGHFG
jgi:hypothetical protein